MMRGMGFRRISCLDALISFSCFHALILFSLFNTGHIMSFGEFG